MSNASEAVDDQPPYPSFEELKSAQTIIWRSSAGFRLFWTLDSPFPEAISVMKDRHCPDSLTPYFSNGTFHPISQEPISVPKISSVTVRVDELDQWESAWTNCHNQHEHIGPTPPGMWYGSLEDYDPARDSDREVHKLGCCGEARPRGKRVGIVVRPASGDFVTVHDYLSTVHPWLMSSKNDIESARAEIYGEYNVSDLMVRLTTLDWLFCEEKSQWIKDELVVWNRPSTTVPAPIMLPVFGPHPQPSELQPLPQTSYSFGGYYYEPR